MKKENFHHYLASIAGIASATSANFINYRDWYSLVENLPVGGLMALGTGIIGYSLSRSSENRRILSGYQDARDFMIGFITTDLIFKGLENLVL